MRDEGANANAAVRGLDPVEPGNLAQAHEIARANQSLPHHGDQGGAARDHSGLVPMLTQDGERFVERPRRRVLEGVHARLRWAAVRIDSMIL